MLKIKKIIKNNKAIHFCNEFIHSDRPKYIFGRNSLSLGIMKHIDIDGIIDDFTNLQEFNGKPIVPISEIPSNALVVSVVTAKPFIAEKRMAKFQFDFLDYFAFYRYSTFPLETVMFGQGMQEDIKLHFKKYQHIYSLLKDKESKNQFFNIVNFRVSFDLDFMRGFSNQENNQYFENFLPLNKDEIFVDIGGFDGFTTQEFIKRCTNYKEVYFFEPEEKNMVNSKKNLKNLKNIHFYQLGLSNRKGTLRFNVNGSSSAISENGTYTIEVDTLDNVLKGKRVSFIKMDIEGGELDAIEGAQETIRKHHPKMAISVYHKKDDFWKIPQVILCIRSDYDIYLRHYTEGIVETVMYFIPQAD